MITGINQTDENARGVHDQACATSGSSCVQQGHILCKSESCITFPLSGCGLSVLELNDVSLLLLLDKTFRVIDYSLEVKYS